MKRRKGFLFDLDGVLIDSEREYTRIWEEIDHQWPTGVENFAYIIKGTTLPHILDTYFPKALHQEINTALLKMQSEMAFYYTSGARDFLTELRSRGIPSAIVTSSDSTKINLLHTQLPELFELVDSIIDANSITHSKPHPEGYLLAASRLGLEGADCVVFEDAAEGAKAGKSAGAFVVGISTTLGREAMMPESDIVVDSLSDPILYTLL